MSDLLPCPFCGGKNLLVTTNEFGGFCLTCKSCYAVGPPAEYEPKQMREAWNTRSQRIRQEVREEALREAAAVSKEMADQYVGYMSRIEQAILALITKDADNG